MDYNAEVLKAIETGNKAFDEFKKNITSRIDGLENLQAKGNRPRFAGEAEESKGIYDARTLTGEQKSFGDFLRLGETKAMSTGSAPDGGFAVPKVIDGMIETLLLKQSPMRGLASVTQISTPDFHKLVDIRGEDAQWASETASRPATNTPQFADVAPPMGDLYANPQATQQMLDDVFFNVEQWLAETIADKFASAEGSAFISGDGINKPKGILSATINNQVDGTRAFGAVQYLPSGAAGAFASTNPTDFLINTIASVKPGYRKSGDAGWLMSPNTLAQLMQLKDTLGRPLVMPSYASGDLNMLLGYPVYEDQWMPDVAANSYSIAFGNFKRAYLIVDRIGTRVVRDPFSNKPNVGFYTVKRTGGGIVNSEALKLIKFAAS